MRTAPEGIVLSAGDLSNHLACRHQTALDLAAARGLRPPPTYRDPALEVLQERGLRHERAYLDHLTTQGLELTCVTADLTAAASVANSSCDDAPARAIALMHQGADVIVQASLADGRWRGRADVLLRVAAPSALGEWSYEVVDTKLARQTKGGTILQLCLYSDLVGRVQERMPERMHVISPGRGFEPETFRTNDYLAYYRYVSRRLAQEVSSVEGDDATYPEPVEHCEICRWWQVCSDRRRSDDHLSLVAGISTLQRRELEAHEVTTLARLARLPLPLERPRRGSREALLRAREQARVQLEGREQGAPVYELLEREPGDGLARLPEPSPGDVFFDLEGDAFVGEAGMEYLFGYAILKEGASQYCAQWALTPAEERAAFEAFVDMVSARWEQYPDLHVYHYAPYEPSALRRLMGRYGTREAEVDRMLRAGLFVDLYAVVRRSVRASVERYSIKDLEVFHGYVRAVPLREASLHLRSVEWALELGQGEDLTHEARATVETYNRDDCVSTFQLREWLETLRSELVAGGEVIGRPELSPGDPSERVDARRERMQTLKIELAGDVPFDRAVRTNEEHARLLLAEMLEWHWREQKVVFWEYYRLRELPAEELFFERAALAGLEFVGRVGGTDRCPVDRYRFPPQDSEIRDGADVHWGEGKLGTVYDTDPVAHTVDIKKRGDTRDIHPTAVFEHTIVNSEVLSESLFRLAEWVRDHGVEGPGEHQAARDLLLGLPPRVTEPVPLRLEGEDTLTAARRVALLLDHSVLPIQGPPGSGKTYAAARMICDLVRAEKTVGISAVSHKVIRNLLDGVVEAAAEEGVELFCAQKISGVAQDTCAEILELTDNAALLDYLACGRTQVAAGTAWVWARPDFRKSVDVLFVDEAGQMSLANALAVSQAAESIVLLGDPQQLEQPQQGSHPEGTDVSALEHLLQGRQTIAGDRGLFLDETWRLHPDICAFTSELFYEGRLDSRPGLENQALVGLTPFAGARLWFVPVDHEGNQNSSPEEVEVVGRLVESLMAGVRWVDSKGVERALDSQRVLVVCPYNAQVADVTTRLPGHRVGTVDKFQGQEAPVVVYSLTTSSPEEAPRGMEFLYSLNRLNVATSRARTTCIMVASPRLFEVDCRTPRQMQLANAFCRYLEMAEEVRAW